MNLIEQKDTNRKLVMDRVIKKINIINRIGKLATRSISTKNLDNLGALAYPYNDNT